MKTAIVTLTRDNVTSPMMTKTYNESVRGIVDIIYQPHHIVFILEDGFECAYKADRIHEFVTTYEEE